MIQCAIDLIELIGLPFQSLYGIELFDVSIIRFGQMCRVCIVTSTSIHLSQSGPTVVILGAAHLLPISVTQLLLGDTPGRRLLAQPQK